MIDGKPLLRAGDAADLEAVLTIAGTSTGAPQWAETMWREVLQPSMDGPQMRQLFVAVEASRVAGFVVVARNGAVAEIEGIAVLAEVRRRGLGAVLCRHAMRWAAGLGALQMELEVRSQSVEARAFYATLGFVEQGVRKGYYERPKDDAVLLSATL